MVYVRKNWWKILIIIVFTMLLLYFANTHEHWSDEAQSFLLARDNSFQEIMYWIKYEGTPPLWVLIIKCFIILGGTYKTFYLLPIIFSVIGVSIFELKIKAPWYIKLLFPFSYFIFYQYSIIARSYCLIFPLLMIILLIYDKRLKKSILYATILFFFMNISLHTLIISGSLYLLFLIDVYKDNKFKSKRNLIACIMIFFELLLTMIWTLPNSDCSFIGNGGNTIFHVISEATIGNDFNIMLEIIVTIFMIGIIIFKNKGKKVNDLIRLLILFVPVLMVYLFITYQVWHVGIIFFLILFYFIIDNSINTNKLIQISFVVILVVQIYWSLCSLGYDYKNNYSASKDVAEFLIKNNYDNESICGLGYSVTAIQPYFNRNIFENQNTNKSFYFWKKNNGYDNIMKTNKDIYVISKFYKYDYIEEIEWLEENNYRRIDFNGYTYKKSKIYESEGYYIYIKGD